MNAAEISNVGGGFLRRLVPSLLALVLAATSAVAATGCATSDDDEDELVFEDGEKEDVVRPFGSFKRSLRRGETGLFELALEENKTFTGKRYVEMCLEDCEAPIGGTFRWARSGNKTFVVLEDKGSGEKSKIQYQLDRNEKLLSLLPADSNVWLVFWRQNTSQTPAP